MKPFTPIDETHNFDEVTNLRISISPDGEYVYLNEFVTGAPSSCGSYMMIDHPTAEWLHKQLGKALKQPKGE